MRYIYTLVLLGVISVTKSFAQQDPLLSQYLFNPLVYNPAYAGAYNMTSVNAQSRIQSFSGGLNSFTNIFSANTSLPSTETMGLGLNVISDRAGVSNGSAAFRRTEVDLAYSYKIDIAEGVHLSAGLQANVLGNRIDNSGLNLKVDNDPNFPIGQIGKTQMNFGTGLYLLNEERYFLSFAIPRLLNTTATKDNLVTATSRRTYYLSGGVILNREGSIPIRPAFLVRSMEGAKTSLDISASALLSDVIWVGASVRNGKTVAIIGQLDISEHVRIGYSTDIPVSGFVFKNLGTHELSLNVNFGAFKNQVVAIPRYF